MYIYIICSLLFLLSIIKKDSKVLFYTTFFLLWVLMAFNYNNADYNMYKNLYHLYGNSSELFSSEILFQILCKIGNYFDISYRVFIAIYSIIPVTLMAIAFRKLTKNSNLVVGLYMLFPFLLDAVQIRHFMAISIILFGIQFLITENKKDIWKYLICNIIAIGFHYIAAFCLLFILVKFFENKKILFFCITLDILLIVFIVSGLGVSILSNILPSEKVQAYFLSTEYRPSNWVIIMAMCLQAMTVVYAYILANVWHERYDNDIYQNEGNKNIEKEKNTIELILKINNLSLLLIPTFIFNIQLYRISRTILILNYIMLGITFGKKNRKDDIVILLVTAIVIVCFFYLRVIQNNVFDTTAGALVNYNYLLEKIFNS